MKKYFQSVADWFGEEYPHTINKITIFDVIVGIIVLPIVLIIKYAKKRS